jgi:hypothetical protein
MINGNTGTFGGAATGRSPATSLPGRANFSGGSTSTTLRPSGPITGGPNNTNDMFAPGTTRGDMFNQNALNQNALNQLNQFNQNALRPGGIRSASGVPLAPIVPIVPFAAQASEAPTAAIVPVVPNAPIVPIIVTPGEAQTSGRSGVAASIPATPREAPIEQTGVATATAFPTRNPTATGDATVNTTPPAAANVVQSQVVPIPTGRASATTTYRGSPSAVGQRSGFTYTYPGYTQWQGHYWFHSPGAGWHYWDGLRWVQFENRQN